MIERFGLVAPDYESERRSPRTFFRHSHIGRFNGANQIEWVSSPPAGWRQEQF